MKSLKVLDVTLRDGGCVNDFNFGQVYMDKILNALERSDVDIIELGYIDEKKGTERGRTQFCNEIVIPQYFLRHKKPGVTYVAMMDYGKFDIDNLQLKTDDGIDGIRMAFHKENLIEAIAVGRKIVEKGYEFFVQPMITLRYSDSELIRLIELVNKELPDASGFYIVDSFGEMRPNDMNRILNLIDHNLNPRIPLGFHSHNNLQMSYSNAIALLQFPTNRNIMLDSSIMGMGKGAGNLNTELLLEHLNIYYGKQYNVVPLLEVIDKVINQLHSEFYWGYAVEYYLSSINHCTPSYASHFYNKHMLPVDQVAELLGMIAENKKNSFDKNYAEELYRKFNERKSIDDEQTVQELRKKIKDKTVLIIAPGKSILEAKDEINTLIDREDVISISLNNFDLYETDYVFATRVDIYESAIKANKNVIATSNITKGGRGSTKVIDYKKWIIVGDDTQDSSGVIILNLLNAFGALGVVLAGFDGFSININDNYYDMTLRHPVTERQSNSRNEFFKEFIKDMKKNVNIEFLTRSLYEV